MLNKIIKIQKDLHARPATLLIQKVQQIADTAVWIEKEGRKIQINSLIALLSMGLKKDSEVILITEGKNEEEGLNILSAFIEKGCNEE